jgi:hypothetical protein
VVVAGLPKRSLRHLAELVVADGGSRTSFIYGVVPDALIEHLDEHRVPGWGSPASPIAREAGDRWLDEARSAALTVPSVVTRIDRNLLLNPAHPSFAEIAVGPELPVAWDHRLFRRPA